MPTGIEKFLSVKLATLVLALYFIDKVECVDWMKVTALACVSAIFIIAKTVQNILLGDKETK